MTESNDKSRVLTLVFTDLADSTALKREVGDDAADALITRHRDHVVRLSEDCSGRVIDWAGDGCFLTFETSSAAVMFSLRLQEAHSDETDLPGVRVGVHMGEVTEKIGHDGATQIKGLAVDLAARIQSLAKPGQVLLSAAVYDSARQRIGVDALGHPVLWQTHGAYTLKGFDKPLDIGEAGLEGVSPLKPPEASEKAQPLVPAAPPEVEVELMPEVQSSAARRYVTIALFFVAIVGVTLGTDFIAGRLMDDGAVAPAADGGSIKTIAVLPLDNMSSDPEQEYFVDGMTEALIAELAKIKSIKVISRTSVMQYEDTDKSLPEIARELGVDALVEGSVMKANNDVRITAQLVHGITDEHLWAESYTDTLDNVFQVQAEFALTIAREISASLTPEEKSRITDRSAIDSDAYDAYLRGRHHWNRRTHADLLRALEYFEQAVAIAPDFALAFAAIADTYSLLGAYEYTPTREAFPKAIEVASKALKIDPLLGEAYVSLGYARASLGYNFDEASLDFERGIELNPSFEQGYSWYAGLLTVRGETDRGRTLMKTARILDPLSPLVQATMAQILLFEHNFDEAIQTASRILEIDADAVVVLWWRGVAELCADRPEEAAKTLEHLVDITNRRARFVGYLGLAYARLGDREQALSLVREIEEEAVSSATAAYYTALIHLGLGDLDETYGRLNASLVEFHFGSLELLACPLWDPLRDDSRFQTILDQLNAYEPEEPI